MALARDKMIAVFGCLLSLGALLAHGLTVIPAALAQGQGVAVAISDYLAAFAVLTQIGALLVYLSFLAPEGRLRFFRVSVHRAAIAAAMLFIVFFQQVTQSVENLPGYPASVPWALLLFIAPFFYLAWWLGFDRTRPLEWAAVPRMLAYPVVYVLIVIARGLLGGNYPSSLLDLTRLGQTEVFANSLMLFVLFGAICVLIVVIDRLVPRR